MEPDNVFRLFFLLQYSGYVWEWELRVMRVHSKRCSTIPVTRRFNPSSMWMSISPVSKPNEVFKDQRCEAAGTWSQSLQHSMCFPTTSPSHSNPPQVSHKGRTFRHCSLNPRSSCLTVSHVFSFSVRPGHVEDLPRRHAEGHICSLLAWGNLPPSPSPGRFVGGRSAFRPFDVE